MVELNKKEQEKVDVIKQVIQKNYTQQQASIKLGISDRQIRRLVVLFKTEGEQGFIHKNRGKKSNKKIEDELVSQIIRDYLTEYSDYNFAHFYDERGKNYGIGFTSMFRIFQKEDVISPLAQHKTVQLYNEKMKVSIKEGQVTEPQEKLYLQRKKEAEEKHIRKSSLYYSFGEEIQMDAAFYLWFGKEATALHLTVDKATKKVLYGWFDYQETTEAYMIILMNILNIYGIPKKIKTDKRSTFSINTSKSSKSHLNFTVFGRICKELEIELQCNSNPLFKPNIERENGTFKGRLKAELNHHKIQSIEEANQYLNEIFIPKMNERFSYEINPNKNCMRSNSYTQEELNLIISIHFQRKIDNASSVKFFNQYYMPADVETGEIISFSNGTECIVIKSYDKKLYGMIHEKLYFLVKVGKPEPKVYQKVLEKKYTGHKPSDNHPWKRNMMLK